MKTIFISIILCYIFFMSIKLTIVYDNTSLKKELKADWGFACVAEVESGKKILFDTGAAGAILLSNMQKLSIDPRSIDIVFISHNHFDHIGGLSQFLQVNSGSEIYIPQSLKGLKRAERVHSIGRTSVMIEKNVYSTGELEDIEQSLIIKSRKGLVVITGCSHSTVKLILERAAQLGKVHALIGGLHGFEEFELISEVSLVCPTHCTAHIEEINKIIGNKFLRGGVGREIII
jgi:7,8-dihydropterin-6-yl-methyl-4-(beta-D-ribofuranosyl)aminobenzene 5'-phosphate synthase